MKANSLWQIAARDSSISFERQKDDFYATNPIAIDKLLTKETLTKEVWEPACGQGHFHA